jgi:cytochrome c peroxidase
MLTLTLDETTKEIIDYNGEGRRMGQDIKREPTMGAVVAEYQQDYNRRQEEDRKRRTAEEAMAQGLEKFVGADMCARCHIEEYTAWSQTPHARAYQTLVESEQEAVDECLVCHVVGYGQPTGYEVSWKKKDKGKEETLVDNPSLRNVQCESCHGIGTLHGTVVMEKAPGEKTCLTCHTGEYGEGFNYAEAVAKVH